MYAYALTFTIMQIYIFYFILLIKNHKNHKNIKNLSIRFRYFVFLDKAIDTKR